MKAVVTVNDLTIKYQTPKDEITAVSAMSFTVYEKEFVSIVGPSGCGKSSLLSAVSGMIMPSSGELLVNGSPPCPDGSVGYMLQRDTLFEWRSCFKNMLLGCEVTGAGKSKKQISSLAKKYELTDFLEKYPSEISGGMRQRVALIRTLALSPKLMLLDEAFSGLDAQTRTVVSEDILKIIKSEGMTAIMVTHDIAESILLSDRVIVLTNRPAKVKDIINIEFSHLASTKEKRMHPLYGEYFAKIGEELGLYE